MIPRVGDQFRQFRIVEKVGEGGMGQVFRAHDTRLNRDVALKFLTRLGPVDSEYAVRLRLEAQSLAALSHANIVTIYDIDESEGVPFLILEWVSGTALSQMSHPAPCDETRFLNIGLAIAEALAAAHESQIVHRDVKPGNVLIADDGRVKLVDFGLAKLPQGDAQLTRSGMVVGTVAYMSPEQASGGEVGPASDVFSFGVLAYELLTGTAPFRRDSTPATLYAIVHEPVAPLHERRPEISRPLAALVDRCLSKNPEARFATGSELASELHHAARQRSAAETREVRGGASKSAPAIGQPKIRFCTASDGAGIAYSVSGSGPVLVRVLGWFTHLEMEWQWPALRLFWERLSEHFTVVRYDGRGIGLSDPWRGDFTEDGRQMDLDAVLNAVGASQAILCGISEGAWTAATYALGRPERLTHLILYGGYSRGRKHRPGYDAEMDAALMTLMRKGWGRDSPVFRQIFTFNYFRTDADPGLVAHFNQLQRASADPETAARYESSLAERGDVSEAFSKIRIPTLVIHCRDDQIVDFQEGRRLASIIPGAEFLPLPTGTHYFPTEDGVTHRLVEAITRFTRPPA